MAEQMLSGLQSPVDERDYKVSDFLHPDLKIPKTLDLRPWLLPIRDQGQQGACVAMAAASMKELQEFQDNNLFEYMAPQFIYDNRVNQASQGMFGRDLMRVLLKLGDPREKSYHYGSPHTPDKIPEKVVKEAFKYRIEKYAAILTVDELKAALCTNGVCLIMVPVYHSYSNMWVPDPGQPPATRGHCMSVVGWNNKGFILRNSWGPKWNNNGHTLFPFSDWGKHWECWTTVDSRTGSKRPQPLPFLPWVWIRRYFFALFSNFFLTITLTGFFAFFILLIINIVHCKMLGIPLGTW